MADRDIKHRICKATVFLNNIALFKANTKLKAIKNDVLRKGLTHHLRLLQFLTTCNNKELYVLSYDHSQEVVFSTKNDGNIFHAYLKYLKKIPSTEIEKQSIVEQILKFEQFCSSSIRVFELYVSSESSYEFHETGRFEDLIQTYPESNILPKLQGLNYGNDIHYYTGKDYLTKEDGVFDIETDPYDPATGYYSIKCCCIRFK